ncbi:hypothetical protein PsorP6_004490 [Peronosclerospora sorghi]|uniref:Uncharacterized protein n=1 Tax=Peronosclerospora sorghi TaxID=230839 RepID=A0ACC0VQ11_9STRA|nr:hypothetical protein PsorP6_004490 [Peronosclerospora sorghi]
MLRRAKRGWGVAIEHRRISSTRWTCRNPSSYSEELFEGTINLITGLKQRVVVEIGDVKAPIKAPRSRELVPHGYLTELQQERSISQTLLGHLRWMMQKDILKQDMFLIGHPGSSRRRLSMQFCELFKREVEYIAISQDTTESDLKQRREIMNGAAIFTDQAPVRAAINGRVLVIDGLEKAERNVLPTLNNLLENREMMLDDGRFLMKAESYDALMEKGYTLKDLQAQKLVRVHPDFRVIGLGLPTPPYAGRTLDPPLRSRFQGRHIQSDSPGSQLEALVANAPSVPLSILEKLVGIREAVNTIEATYDLGTSRGPRMPHLDFLSLSHCAKLLEKCPSANVANAIQRSFPVQTDVFGPGSDANSKAFDRIVAEFTSDLQSTPYVVEDVVTESGKESKATVTLRAHQTELVLPNVPCGTARVQMGVMPGFVETNIHREMLADMIQDHAAGRDLCVLGAKGSGKSALVRLFAHRLGYVPELFSLFKDMTTRDLVQRRSTDAHGNTRWEDSPLIHAARHGHLAVLDGVHRLGSDSLGVLQRLLQDREIDLTDGTKLVSQSTYDAIVAETKQSGDVSALNRVAAIHPSFRVIAIAEVDPATLRGTGSMTGKISTAAWLNSDTISMFSFHHLPSIAAKESEEVVRCLYPHLPQETTRMLLSFTDKLENATKQSTNADYLALSLSMRQLLRICRRLNAFPEQSLQDLRPLLHDTLLTQFLSSSCSELVDSLLDECNAPILKVAKGSQLQQADTIRQEGGYLHIGNVSYPIQTPQNPELVPQPQYFDTAKHTRSMKDMLQDVVAGQNHMLLIGNQGVGKNKLADRLLQLIHQEREYIQLHRDTTVHTLTLAPTLIDGKIEWQDSPLVRAAKTGRTLIVDEADKAPLEVVCILKGLIEDGEMLLGNGKRLIDPNKVTMEEWHDNNDVIQLHPNFRMWVLANRPGFPFLGNNFFREIGDIFASHAIENPDEDSELSLLTAYAPNVPLDSLRRLCQAFAELRGLVENGTITYPYSTREAVAVAKHLQEFPTDDVGVVLENVLAFDAYDHAMLAQLADVFMRHGIPLFDSGGTIPLVFKKNIAKANSSRVGELSTPKTGLDTPKHGKEDPKNEPHVGGNTWAGGTGGSDTAGLGGRGGPYRLDKGHPVHQVSQAKKDEVSAEARAKAQAIAQEALAQKLREIDMSDREWETYQLFFQRIERESAQLRAVLANLEAVTQERSWLRHQVSGELDDSKLVDGIAGERLVFKRRGVSDSSFQSPARPQGHEMKQMLFVMDVSGSMYRFNGQDSRLERMLETTLMIMESFAGFERELNYAIMGHSGDSPEIPLVEFGAPPRDRKERLRVLKKMVAHSQFCRQGDHTVEAVERGVQRVAALEGAERFVFVVSDANLERYGIEPRYLGRKLVADPDVQAHALFIASFADEAEEIRRELPQGRGHVCLNTSDLPRILKQIFTSALTSV